MCSLRTASPMPSSDMSLVVFRRLLPKNPTVDFFTFSRGHLAQSIGFDISDGFPNMKPLSVSRTRFIVPSRSTTNTCSLPSWVPSQRPSLQNIDVWVQQATFSPKRATRRLRRVGHQPTRPVNCLLAKATHRNPVTSPKAPHPTFYPVNCHLPKMHFTYKFLP